MTAGGGEVNLRLPWEVWAALRTASQACDVTEVEWLRRVLRDDELRRVQTPAGRRLGAERRAARDPSSEGRGEDPLLVS